MQSTAASDDCGYSGALEVLLGAGPGMAQKTPPATEPRLRGTSALTDALSLTAADNGARFLWDERGEEQKESPDEKSSGKFSPYSSPDDDQSSKNKKRTRQESWDEEDDELLKTQAKRPRRKDVESAGASNGNSNSGDAWRHMIARETESPHRTLPNYPDVAGSCSKLSPGTRRRAVNAIYVMAGIMNLEIGTPSFAVLLMDRFLSSRREPIVPHTVMLVAMVCLNVAGKLVDIDRGYCGSKGVMQMMRAAVPPNIRGRTQADFDRCAYQVETILLRTLDNNPIQIPPAAQYIAEMTSWNELNQYAWLEAVLLCDVFAADTASTMYCQWEIARAVIAIVCQTEAVHRATSALSRAAVMFLNSAQVGDMRLDPYFGARLRHSRNPATEHLLARYVSLRNAMESPPHSVDLSLLDMEIHNPISVTMTTAAENALAQAQKQTKTIT